MQDQMQEMLRFDTFMQVFGVIECDSCVVEAGWKHPKVPVIVMVFT